MRTSLRRQRRGFALVDFITGTAIFAGAVLAFAGLTRTKFEVLHEAGALQIAQSELEQSLDRVRREGLPQEPTGQADGRGFQQVTQKTTDVTGLGPATQTLSARPLVVLEGGQRRIETSMVEVRVALSWPGGALHLTTVVPRGGAK